jgi:hypothetical protein
VTAAMSPEMVALLLVVAAVLVGCGVVRLMPSGRHRRPRPPLDEPGATLYAVRDDLAAALDPVQLPAQRDGGEQR